MIPDHVLQQFNLADNILITRLNSGLIHTSYKVEMGSNNSLLQRVNKNIFKHPRAVQHNYNFVRNHLLAKDSFRLPAILPTKDHDLLYETETEAWRCFEFVEGSFSPEVAATADQAYKVSFCFGKFAADLADLPSSDLAIILPDFHNLNFRFQQFEAALKVADEDHKMQAASLIDLVYRRRSLVAYHDRICRSSDYPLHIFHHDCKIGNILFSQSSQEVITLVDMDTVQPGLFFSDVGDMLRSMVPNKYEDDPEVGELEVRKDFFKAVIDGYKDATSNFLNQQERQELHLSCLVITYMQAMRFLTDFLNGNVYYQVAEPLQNKTRAANQLQLLALMERYLKDHKQQGPGDFEHLF